MELAPGTVLDRVLASAEGMSQEDREALVSQYNLDKPMIYRYGLYMMNFIQGDLGVSDHTGLRVWDTFIRRLPNTLLLSFTSIVIATVISVPLGIIAARRARTLYDTGVTVLSLIGMSVPVFWLGLLLILAFSLYLRWLPSGLFEDGIRSLILPALCSSFMLMATATRQTRSNMLEVLNADYMRTARAKGVPEEKVIRRHGLGNAWIPIVTAIGTNLGAQITGSVVVESVFAWPGIGRMAAEAVVSRDVTTTTGVVIMTTILFVLIQLGVDVLYANIDPRIKAQYVNKAKKKKKNPVPAGAPASPVRGPASVVIETPASAIEKTGSAGEAPAVPVLAGEPGPQPVCSGSAFVTRENIGSGAKHSGATGKQSSVSENDRDPALVIMKYKKRSQLGEISHSLRRNKGAMAGLIILCFMVVLFFVSLFISWEAVTEMNGRSRFAAPSWQHPFGADNFGRDMMLRTIYGTRYTLAIGFGVVSFGAIIGVPMGCFAGFYGGKVDDIIMRITDAIAALPGLLLGMVIVTVLGQSLPNLIIAVAIPAIPIYIRMTRASVITLRNNEFVEAARAIGLPNYRIIFAQVLPNGWAPIIVTLTASLGVSIILAASLSYMGFGVPVPQPEWGALISTASEFARRSPHIMLFPGLFIMLTVLALNLLGDGLRDALDPKMKGS